MLATERSILQDSSKEIEHNNKNKEFAVQIKIGNQISRKYVSVGVKLVIMMDAWHSGHGKPIYIFNQINSKDPQ